MAKGFYATGDIAVDRCWGLLPLFMMSALLSMLIPKNSALFYVAFMDEFSVSHQSASWPLTLHNVMTHIAGLLVWLLQDRLSIYHVAILGSLLNLVALIASAFVPNIAWMCITMGIASGVGVGMNLLSLSIFAMLYFDRYRATASGFKYAGTTLAPLIFPIALSAVIRQYDLNGTLLILSAFTANTLPLTMLMKNPKPTTACFRKARDNEQDGNDGKGTRKKCSFIQGSPDPFGDSGHTARNTLGTNEIYASNAFPLAWEVSSSPKMADMKTGQKENDGIPLFNKTCEAQDVEPVSKLRVANGTTLSSAEKTRKYGSFEPPLSLSVSECAFAMKSVRNDYAESHKIDDKCDTGPIREPTRNNSEFKVRDEGSNSSFFLNPVLYLLVATFTIGEYTSNTFESTVLDYALDKGLERKKAEPIISYVAASEIVGRLVVPFLWEKAQLRRSVLLVICLLAEATCFLATPHATTPAQVVAAAMATGLPAGCVIALKPVLLSDNLGVQRLSMCWGILGIAMTPVCLAGPLLIGVFRDSMGSYDNLYRMMSALCVAFALAVFAFSRLKKPTERE